MAAAAAGGGAVILILLLVFLVIRRRRNNSTKAVVAEPPKPVATPLSARNLGVGAALSGGNDYVYMDVASTPNEVRQTGK